MSAHEAGPMPAPGNRPGPGTRLVAFLGLRRSMAGLLSMVVLVGMGEHMAERFLPLYLQDLTGRGPLRVSLGVLSIGILAFMDDLLSALYSFPGGYLSDRLGTKRALVIFNLLSMAGYLVVILVHRWWAVLVGAAFFISWSAISLPATMELISRAVPRTKRAMGVSLQSLVRRIPKTLGPLAGGVLIGLFGIGPGTRVAFGVALGLALAAMVLQQALIEDDAPARKAGAEKNPLRLYREMNADLRALLVSDTLIRFCERIPDAFVVVWVTDALVARLGPALTEAAARQHAAFSFGVLSVIENVTAVLVYIPVAHLADRFGKKPFVAITFGFFALFPLALLFSHSFWALVPVFILRGLKEFGEPTRKALIMDLAPENRKAAMFGLYYLIRDVIVSLAAFSGALLWGISPRLNLLTALAFGVMGSAWFVLRGRDLGAPAAARQGGRSRRS